MTFSRGSAGHGDAPVSGSTLHVFRYFFRAYPVRSAVMIVLMLGAGVAEGVGVITLIPVVQLANAGEEEAGGVSQTVAAVFRQLGLEVTLPVLLAFIVFAIVVKAALLFFAQTQVGFTVAAVVRDLRLELMRSLLEARWSYFLRKTPGQFANSISAEARRSANAYQETCASLAALFQMAAYMAVALVLSWIVALGAVITAAILTLVAGPLFALSRSSGRQWTRSSRLLASRFVEVLQGVKALKAMGRERLVWPLLEQETEELNQARRREVVASQALRSTQEPVLTLLLAVGLYAVLELTGLPLSSALVMAFVFYRLMTNLNILQHRYQGVLSGESAFFSLQHELVAARSCRESWPGTKKTDGVHDGLRLVDLSFSYDETPVLVGIDAVFPAASLSTIHGESGSGKTTLADLLAGLIRPTGGQILVDDVVLEELDLAAWRSQLGYVPQETLLFNGSIMDNVTLGDSRYSRRDAQKALELAGAADVVSARKDGLDAWIGDRGSMLSGGQRQRIALARALIGQPSLLLLDEVTAGLDPATEAKICETLRALRSSVTIVSISHQSALREIADHVYVIRDGRLHTAVK